MTRAPRLGVASLLLALVAAGPVGGAAAAQGTLPVPDLIQRVVTPSRAAEGAVAEGEWALAESRFRDALLEALLLRGSLDLLEERWNDASDAFDAARGAIAEPRRADVARALLAIRRGRAAEALPILRGVAARYPDDTRSRRLLAHALFLEGRLPEAVEELEEALGSAPGDGELVYALATAHLRLGEPRSRERAAELFERLAAERQGAPTAVLIGRSYLDHRHHDEARAWLERALAIDPAARRAAYYLGKVVLQAQGYDGLEGAAAHFRQELETAPLDPLASLYLGIVLAEMRRCDEALVPLEQAVAEPMTALDALRFVAKCRLAAGGDANDRQARTALEQALEIARRSGRTRQLESVHYQLGIALRRLGEPEGAAEHFAAAERLSSDLVDEERAELAEFFGAGPGGEPAGEAMAVTDPVLEAVASLDEEARRELRRWLEQEIARAYANLGTLASRDGRPDAAAELLTAAGAHDPALPGLDRNLGLAAFAARRYELAAQALGRVHAADPSDADVGRALALAHLNLESYEEAARHLAADPARTGDPALQYAYALALVRSGRAEEAAAAYETLFRDHPDWPELHVLLGQARAQQGDFPGAVAALERALALRQDVPEAHATLGEIHLRRGELDAAIAAFEAELAHTPDAVPVRYQLAVALDLANRPQEALGHLETVLRRRPAFVNARYLTGKILLGENRPEEAKSHLLVAAGEAPRDPNVQYQLALALQRLGEREAASERFGLYRELKAAERGDGP